MGNRRERVGIGGAGNVMLPDGYSPIGRILVSDSAAGTTVIGSSGRNPSTDLEYRNGVWRYNVRPGYGVVSVIERISLGLIHHVALYDDEDVFHTSEDSKGIIYRDGSRSMTLETSGVDIALDILSKQLSHRMKIVVETFRSDLNAIADLEKTLRRELGQNYRGKE